MPVTSQNISGNAATSSACTGNAASATKLSNDAGSAPSYSCRAWVNFIGTGTVAIRASGNVSSITDNGTGDYTVNFTNAMPDANYAQVGIAGNGTNTALLGIFPGANYSTTTSLARLQTATNAGLQDCNYVCVSIFR